MKLLVIANSEAMRTTLTRVGKVLGFEEVKARMQSEAARIHWNREQEYPTHVILDYDDIHPDRVGSRSDFGGIGRSPEESMQEFALMSRMIRVGFMRAEGDDYLRLPARIEEFRKKLLQE